MACECFNNLVVEVFQNLPELVLASFQGTRDCGEGTVIDYVTVPHTVYKTVIDGQVRLVALIRFNITVYQQATVIARHSFVMGLSCTETPGQPPSCMVMYPYCTGEVPRIRIVPHSSSCQQFGPRMEEAVPVLCNLATMLYHSLYLVAPAVQQQPGQPIPGTATIPTPLTPATVGAMFQFPAPRRVHPMVASMVRENVEEWCAQCIEQLAGLEKDRVDNQHMIQITGEYRYGMSELKVSVPGGRDPIHGCGVPNCERVPRNRVVTTCISLKELFTPKIERLINLNALKYTNLVIPLTVRKRCTYCVPGTEHVVPSVLGSASDILSYPHVVGGFNTSVLDVFCNIGQIDPSQAHIWTYVFAEGGDRTAGGPISLPLSVLPDMALLVLGVAMAQTSSLTFRASEMVRETGDKKRKVGVATLVSAVSQALLLGTVPPEVTLGAVMERLGFSPTAADVFRRFFFRRLCTLFRQRTCLEKGPRLGRVEELESEGQQ